jgi:hypothetical protein
MFLEDVAWLLISAGVIPSGAVKFSSKSSANVAGTMITLIGAGGGRPDATQRDALAYLYPTAQVNVRALTHVAAYNTAFSALLVLGRVSNRAVNGTFYRSIRPLQSEPLDRGLDETKERILMSFNVVGDRRS